MIVVFDAKCLLCSAWVRFLLKHDKQRRFRFASIQGEYGRVLLDRNGLQADQLETLLLVTDGRTYQHTAAILRVLHVLGWPWRLIWILWLLPAPLRDALYRWCARNRYRIFGKSEACYVPSPQDRARFLDTI
ncbi:MAG TPA: thiol-disulfide oxidoreductase DCC family protein [Rhodocyclaceae bacterium]|nr:thiol-disulfide oxidoreductase DCC family protein [Rhodocyclaceae bacterium]